MLTLRDYQQEAVDAARASYAAGNKAPLIVIPTGGGKTSVIADVARSSARKGKRVAIIAHRSELLTQISGTLTRADLQHGMISPKFAADPFALVQVASVQTLLGRLKRQPWRADLLIVDEAHHLQLGNQWGKVYEMLGRPRLLGVTATPCRGDGKGLGVTVGGAFDDLIPVITVKELIAKKHLVPAVVYAPASEIDLSGVKRTGGDYQRKELAGRVDKPTVTGNAVHYYNMKCPGVPAVAFGVSVEHCEHIAADFRAAGWNFQAIDGTMDDNTRKGLIAGLGNGIDGLVSADLIGEGVDIPAIGCVILLRPTQSEGLYLQQVGRALRPCGDKTHAVILDHCGNALVHGLPEDDREWTLDGLRKKHGKGGGGGTSTRQCPACFHVHEMAGACERCGHVYAIAGREIEQVDGELREVTAEIAARIKAEKAREVREAKSLEELKEIGAQRGYKPGWARIQWEERKRREEQRAAKKIKAAAL